MSLKWTDVNEIVYQLIEKYPDASPSQLRFTVLHEMVCGLEEFEDDPNRSNERILEAIVTAWLDEIS